jgi:pimeloyl-ACP methyl ester carboxylesterase
MAPAAFAADAGCEEGVSTREVTFSVVLPDNNTYDISGVLYWRGQLGGKVLQIALHGASYNHEYWDVGEINGHPYSYARYMACHGFSVLAIDNLGTGASSKPDGDLVTIPVEAMALHQIIKGLGSAPVAHQFRKIVLVGHSLGALEAVFLQGVYHDADALVVTGWQNTPHMLVGIPLEALLPLMAEPYVGFPPYLRSLAFYAGDFDPAMPDWDNANLADLVPRGVFGYFFGVMLGMAPTMSQGVTGPVLLVFNEYDSVLFPVSLAALEPATYPNASSVTTHIVPGTGHDLNLHFANVEEWARMKEWIHDNVGGDDAD